MIPSRPAVLACLLPALLLGSCTEYAPTARPFGAVPRPAPAAGLAARAVPMEVTVRRGDSLALIAARNKVRLGSLITANPDIDPDKLRVGQKVRLPVPVASRPPGPSLPPEEIERVQEADSERPPPLSGEGFLLPVRGAVIGSFGPQAAGGTNDGINLAAERGAPVRAAENGVVVYAGDGLPTYGRMILVKHAQRFVTAYAHNDTLAVKVGDTVRRGQTIATVGDSGAVERPQLHFELREGETPIDPTRWLNGWPTASR